MLASCRRRKKERRKEGKGGKKERRKEGKENK